VSKKYEYSTEAFVNPYHFVSLEEKAQRGINYKEIKESNQTLTGWIECRLKTLTPIFIPNTGNENAFSTFQELTGKECKSYDFFSYGDGIPVIPGSEIKGMIRTAFEAVTNSCLSTVEEEKVLYKRTTQPGKPGRLFQDSDGSWKIQPCERYGVNFFKLSKDPYGPFDTPSFREGQELYFKEGGYYKKKIGSRIIKLFKIVSDISETPKSGYKQGYFHKGEPFGGKKRYESIFFPLDRELISVPETAIHNLIENIRLYSDKAVNIHIRKDEHSGYEHLGNIKNIRDLDGALIYYTKHNCKYYLCPAVIGREVFYNRLKDVIKDYVPCDNIENLCPACALFGMVKGKHAVASMVRFTDAIVTDKKENLSDYYDEIVILPELAAPKLSATEFYLKKPDGADLWNYDYAGRWNRKKDREGKLKVAYPFCTLDNYEPQIRGRKFYWHQKIDNVLDIQGAIKLEGVTDSKEDYKRRVAVRPVKKGITFLFKVYFNEITPDELKKLIWVLELGGSKNHAHKIGMGKPIGLGSVQIQIEKVKVRKIILKADTLEYTFEDFSDKSKVTEKNSLNKILVR
jgi:CRISPR-associated protein (TIGR03986 family)